MQRLPAVEEGRQGQNSYVPSRTFKEGRPTRSSQARDGMADGPRVVPILTQLKQEANLGSGNGHGAGRG